VELVVTALSVAFTAKGLIPTPAIYDARIRGVLIWIIAGAAAREIAEELHCPELVWVFGAGATSFDFALVRMAG